MQQPFPPHIFPIAMFRTCIFCHASLGENESIEQFPIGRRLAFDCEKGRLWAICTKCRQWNLSPIEERWEAIEECERRFRDTRLRVSTDQIGLARLADGLELVRIGRPQRPEFAAWRYGDRFKARRRANMIRAGVGLGVLGGIIGVGAAAGIGIGGVGYGLYQLAERIIKGSPHRIIVRETIPGIGDVTVRGKHLPHVRLFADPEHGWQLGVPYRKTIVRIPDDRAISVAGRLLPQINRYGGKRGDVQHAVQLLEGTADPAAFFGRMAGAVRLLDQKIARLSEPMRLALEMAAHEETERRALEGELAVLENAWREAEEVAAIADNLLLPPSVDEFFRRLRSKT
jgi:hypothetical protein